MSFHVAKIWQTANRSPETFCGPRLTACFCSYFSYSFFLSFVCSAFSLGGGTGAFATSAIGDNNNI